MAVRQWQAMWPRFGRHGGNLRPAPASPRELLLALGDYDDAQGIDGFLARFDFAGVTPYQVYYAVRGRLPESAAAAAMPADYDARRHMREMLRSEEFDLIHAAAVVRAFPEKPRLFFVHIPKCAGADLSTHIGAHYGPASLSLFDQGTAEERRIRLPEKLRPMMAAMPRLKALAVTGHFTLGWLRDEHLLRFGDVAFSTLRDPVNMAISKVNFLLTWLVAPETPSMPGIVEWLNDLGLQIPTTALADEELRQLGRNLLYQQRTVSPNTLCQFLGRGSADSALDLCASSNIELTTVGRYSHWLRERWGIETTRRINESRPFLRLGDLTAQDHDYLHDITDEDRRLLALVEAALEKRQSCSILGSPL